MHVVYAWVVCLLLLGVILFVFQYAEWKLAQNGCLISISWVIKMSDQNTNGGAESWGERLKKKKKT
jgi:hypothetical protein